MEPSPKNRAPWHRVIIGAMVVAAMLFAIFGGMVFGGWADYINEWVELSGFLDTCPSNEFRFEQFDANGYGYRETITVNFTTGKMFLEFPEGWDGGWTWFWQKEIRGVFSTMHFELPRNLPAPYDPNQVEEIKKALANLPLSEVLRGESYRDQVHLAFWRQNQLWIGHYSKKGMHPDFQELGKALQIPAGVLMN